MFRELAVSYLGRNDLAHADETDVDFALGTGANEGTLKSNEIPWKLVKKMSSQGFLRGKGSDNLMVVNSSEAFSSESVTPPEHVQVQDAVVNTTGVDERMNQIKNARMMGYEGDSCPECGSFTLVRNGTCLKCDTCGATTGCS